MARKAVAHGGVWTNDKLDRVRKYLKAYRVIFSKSEKARFYTTWYIDAFAGTGYRVPKRKSQAKIQKQNVTLALDFDTSPNQLSEEEELLKGSATLALELASPFDHYLFVEKKRSNIVQLQKIGDGFPALQQHIDVRHGDANVVLQNWCASMNPSKDRAVVFLDPFGMEVSWSLLKTIAQTQAIDLWLLFPLFGINRHLTVGNPPSPAWTARITRVLGTDDWLAEFYKTESDANQQERLLNEGQEKTVKVAGLERLREYFVKRLQTIFAGVATNPLVLRNSMNAPLFLLCFASGNPVGAPIAVRIAQHILKEN